MVDIDLASLGRPAEVFDENTRLIRKEYPHVADADFARGRREMLGRFLARPRIYYTDFFRDRYEAKARANLSRALAKL
jgi:predicted metal-dependent HD superfamily phosphohydrolase